MSTKNTKTTFRKAHARIRNKVLKATPLTKVEKREVLSKARDLLATNYGRGDWALFVGGVEQFCLYGAMQKVSGIEHPSQAWDWQISQCSLTSTLFDALPHQNLFKRAALRDIARVEFRHDRAGRKVTALKVAALQRVNDRAGQAAVLRVFDKAIENLSQKSST